MTRQHTAMRHGLPYESLKKIILEFANNSVLQGFSAPSTKIKHHDQDAMQIGHVGEWCPEAASWDGWEADGDGAVNAMGKGGGKS